VIPPALRSVLTYFSSDFTPICGRYLEVQFSSPLPFPLTEGKNRQSGHYATTSFPIALKLGNLIRRGPIYLAFHS
jgi:hypothetical protein